MKNHNKLFLASELLLESVKIYRNATTDIDYAKAILLAGAVAGIIEPILTENKTEPTKIELLKLASFVGGTKFDDLNKDDQKKEISDTLYFSKLTYNSLKHAGGRKDITAVDDLIFVADLKAEAREMINSAIVDFREIPPKFIINAALSTDFKSFSLI